MFFDRRKCLSVFIFSVCLHYSLWIPSEMLCALHHWTAGKGVAPDLKMPVGHQHGVAGELKEIAFIFNFFTMLKNSCVKGYSFFPGFSLPRYCLVSLLCFMWVAPGCLGCGCGWCWCGEAAQLICHTPRSPAVNWGMLNVVYVLNMALAPGTTSKSSSYLSISKSCPFCEWSRGRVQQLALFAGTNPRQSPLFCQQSLPPWFFQLSPSLI